MSKLYQAYTMLIQHLYDGDHGDIRFLPSWYRLIRCWGLISLLARHILARWVAFLVRTFVKQSVTERGLQSFWGCSCFAPCSKVKLRFAVIEMVCTILYQSFLMLFLLSFLLSFLLAFLLSFLLASPFAFQMALLMVCGWRICWRFCRRFY